MPKIEKSENWREKFEKQIKAVAEEIAANGSAPLYQDGDMVTKARIVIEFDYSYTPTIKYEKEIISKKACVIC